jgi:hypothetical protein
VAPTIKEVVTRREKTFRQTSAASRHPRGIIPAGPVNPAGPMYLYRIKALSPGQVVVQIPHMAGTSDAGQRAYEITLNIS